MYRRRRHSRGSTHDQDWTVMRSGCGTSSTSSSSDCEQLSGSAASSSRLNMGTRSSSSSSSTTHRLHTAASLLLPVLYLYCLYFGCAVFLLIRSVIYFEEADRIISYSKILEQVKVSAVICGASQSFCCNLCNFYSQNFGNITAWPW